MRDIVTTDIYIHFMQVVCYSDLHKLLEYKYSTKLQIFAKFGPVFSSLSVSSLWAIKAWCIMIRKIWKLIFYIYFAKGFNKLFHVKDFSFYYLMSWFTTMKQTNLWSSWFVEPANKPAYSNLNQLEIAFKQYFSNKIGFYLV